MSMGIKGVSQVGAVAQYEASAVKSSEDKLSKKAQDYLADIRSKYGDYDFIIANDSDDKKALVKQSTKSTSVVFSTSEMERMAKDEKYAAQKLKNVDTAVRNGNKIAEGQGVTYEKGSTQSSGLSSRRPAPWRRTDLRPRATPTSTSTTGSSGGMARMPS